MVREKCRPIGLDLVSNSDGVVLNCRQRQSWWESDSWWIGEREPWLERGRLRNAYQGTSYYHQFRRDHRVQRKTRSGNADQCHRATSVTKVSWTLRKQVWVLVPHLYMLCCVRQVRLHSRKATRFSCELADGLWVDQKHEQAWHW